MQESIIYMIILAGGAGLFWRWVDRVDKKIDKIFDKIDSMATNHELEKLNDRIGNVEKKVLSCKNCNN